MTKIQHQTHGQIHYGIRFEKIQQKMFLYQIALLLLKILNKFFVEIKFYRLIKKIVSVLTFYLF